MRRIILFISFIVILGFVLASCGNSNDDTETVNSIYNHLTETVEKEKDFEHYQSNLTELEQEEQNIYNEVISLGNDDKDEMNELIKDALNILDERVENINSIQSMLNDSKAEFEKIESLTSELEDEEKISYLEKMYTAMMERYGAYDHVYDIYIESIQLTKELYEALQTDSLNVGDVYALIDTVNDSYDDIIKANEQFNKETVIYNELKKEFYDHLNEEAD